MTTPEPQPDVVEAVATVQENLTPPSDETIGIENIQKSLDEGFQQSRKEREFMERMVSDKGAFTFEQEVGPGSEKLHHPTKTSGVTVGAGYDMKEKTSDQIINDWGS